MKVKIAYLPGEEREAETLHHFAEELLAPAKVEKADRHPPYKHIYIATEKQPATPCKDGKNVV